MYLHCKQGFVEADRWDGMPLPLEAELHRSELAAAAALSPERRVIIARSRERSTLAELTAFVRRNVPVLESPPAWDYPWRAYLTVDEWAVIMAAVADDLDYRNFKSWCHANADHSRAWLAHEVWTAAFRAGVSGS